MSGAPVSVRVCSQPHLTTRRGVQVFPTGQQNNNGSARRIQKNLTNQTTARRKTSQKRTNAPSKPHSETRIDAGHLHVPNDPIPYGAFQKASVISIRTGFSHHTLRMAHERENVELFFTRSLTHMEPPKRPPPEIRRPLNESHIPFRSPPSSPEHNPSRPKRPAKENTPRS